MDNTIVVALIGATGTVVAPVVTFLLTRPFGSENQQAINRNDKRIITGKWEGHTKPEIGKYANQALLTVLNADAKSKVIKGNFHITYPPTSGVSYQEEEFKFQGGFLYERFLQLDYISTSNSKIQFGSMIIELSQVGHHQRMEGRYVGYGAFSQQIIAGSLTLQRIG